MSQSNSPQRATLTKLILIATIFSLLVIGLGAYTRLVHAGLGCPDWPLCYGHLWAPSSGGESVQASLDFPDTPVDLEKTWPEMTHRYLASSLGLFCIAIVFLSIRVRKESPDIPIKHPVGLLLFIILQGMFGMWTVTLKLWPQVVTLHLLGGFTTFCLLLLLYLRVNRSVQYQDGSLMTRILAKLALAMVTIQVALGGWLTSNYAAMACISLPLCDVSGVSNDDFVQGFNILQQIGPNYLGGQLDGAARIAIHAMHRFGAIASMIIIGLLIVMMVLTKKKRLICVLTILTAMQVCLGLANVYFSMALFNAVAHNIAGALLVGSLVWINFKLAGQPERAISNICR